MWDDAPETIKELQERNLSTECPYCGDTIALIPQHDPINEYDDYSYFIALCPNHKRAFCKPIFAKYQVLNDCIYERYPIPRLDASKIHESIPLSIREDFAEARSCLYAKANKGAVALFRRVVEAIGCDKLGEKAKEHKGDTKKLFELIDLMHEEGLISKSLKESAHEIRLFGNYGVHVQNDGLDKVSSEEASDVREMTWQLLYAIYVSTDKTKKLREKRENKK
ncbi:MAG: DUF4145 domain-containing protein [Candidatus Margulisiibacteriota bacterium]